MGGDWWSRDSEFESLHCILLGSFFKFNCCKNFTVAWKDRKQLKMSPRLARSFLKKLILFEQVGWNFKEKYTLKTVYEWGPTIAQWIRLGLPSCHPGFESQAHHQGFHQFIELWNVEKTKINKKRLGLAHFFKKNCHRTFCHFSLQELGPKFFVFLNKQWPNSGLFIIYFRSYQTNIITNFTTN